MKHDELRDLVEFLYKDYKLTTADYMLFIEYIQAAKKIEDEKNKLLERIVANAGCN